VVPEIGLPASIRASFQGTAQAFRSSLSNGPLLVLAALVTVYIVPGVLYESYSRLRTLFTTPVVYPYMDRLQSRVQRWRAPSAAVEPA
jgi:multidrug efflux pump subunit AcrB